MKRKIMYLTIIFVSLLAMIVFIPNEVKAGYEYINGIKYCVFNQDGFATVDGFDNENLPADGIVEIPEKLTVNSIDYPVTQVRSQAFKDCTKITSITLPETVTSIQNYAFERCYSLEEVIIPEDSILNSIGNGVFKDCTKITSITLPKSLTSMGEYAFERCYGLKTVTIPEDSYLISIGRAAFLDCTALESISIPKSVLTIGECAFERCYSLKTVTVHENSGLTSFEKMIFRDCKSLENITIPQSVTSIGISSFLGCTSLQNIIVPKTVTSIGGMAFHNCGAIKIEYLGNFTNVSNNNDYYLTYSNENYTTKLNATEGNKLIQNNISIKAGEDILDSGNYSYNKDTGILTIPENNITGNVEITAIAKKPYKVTINSVEGVTITPNGSLEDVLEGSNIDIKIKANEGYILTSVKVNGVEQTLPLVNDILNIKDIKEDINVVLEVEKEKTQNNENNTGEGITLRKIEFIGNSENQKFIKETDKTLIFILDNNRGNGKVYVNGVELSEKDGDYTWQYVEGIYPTIILSEEYMKTLKPGKYTIKFEIENVGGAETTFTVIKEINEDITNNDSEVPKTGDNIVIYIATFIVSILGISAIIINKKHSTKD